MVQAAFINEGYEVRGGIPPLLGIDLTELSFPILPLVVSKYCDIVSEIFSPQHQSQNTYPLIALGGHNGTSLAFHLW